MFLSTAVMTAVLIALITLQAQAMYTSAASVMIDIQEQSPIDFQSVFAGNPPDASVIETEVEIIRSRALTDKVVEKLELVQDPEFNLGLQEPGTIDMIKSWISALVPKSLVAEEEEIQHEQFVKDSVADQVRRSLNVYRRGNTYVLNVEFKSYSPEKAAQIANAFADNYLVEQLETKFESTSRVNGWLNQRLEELRNEVRTTEEAVEVYRTNSGLLSAQGSSLSEQQISDLNAQLIVQTSNYEEVKSRLQSVQAQVARGVPPDSIAEVLASPVVAELRRQQAEVVRRKAELSSRYGPRHPDVLEVDRESADIDAQIRLEIDRIVANLQSEVGIAQQKVRTIEQGLARLRSTLSSNNRSLVRLRELEREAAASRTLYENFLEQFKQTNNQEEITEANARVISRAVVPSSQSSPNTPFNIIMGCILGVIFGFGAIVFAEMLDRGLSTGADVEREADVNFIASIPELDSGFIGFIRRILRQRTVPSRYIIDNPLSLIAESFRTLRSTILLSQTAAGDPPKIVAVTSALPGEGKTTVVQSIGCVSAMSGSKTILIDCDLRLRQLSKNFDDRPRTGIVKYLKGSVPLKDVIVTDKETSCDYILNNENEYTHKDLFSSEQFGTLLNELRRKYDLIIIDTAPVLMVADTRTIANLADSVVLAARWRHTNANAVRMAAEILRKVQANIIGSVLTRVNFRSRANYGDGDYSYYARQYGSYYSTDKTDNAASVSQ